MKGSQKKRTSPSKCCRSSDKVGWVLASTATREGPAVELCLEGCWDLPRPTWSRGDAEAEAQPLGTGTSFPVTALVGILPEEREHLSWGPLPAPARVCSTALQNPQPLLPLPVNVVETTLQNKPLYNL